MMTVNELIKAMKERDPDGTSRVDIEVTSLDHGVPDRTTSVTGVGWKAEGNDFVVVIESF